MTPLLNPRKKGLSAVWFVAHITPGQPNCYSSFCTGLRYLTVSPSKEQNINFPCKTKRHN